MRSCTYLVAGIILVRGVGVVGSVCSCGARSCVLLTAWLLADDIKHTVLEGLLVLAQPVLLPGVVVHVSVEVVSAHALDEESFARAVVRLLLELQAAAVLHELSEFRRVAAAQLLQRRFNLLFLNRVVLLVLAAAWQTLPRQRTLHQVEEHVADSLEVIASRLLDTLVRGDRGVSCRTGQVLAVFVRDVLALAVLVALGQTEIDDVDVVASGFSASDQEVIRLDVTMNDSLLVHLLNSLDQLDANQEAGFQIEASLASGEEVFQGWPEQVHDHDMEVLVRRRAVSADVVKSRHARYHKDEIRVSVRA